MPLSYAELKAKLDVDETDYAVLAEMAAGAMPTGAMTEPAKGAKAGPMPTGKMR